MYLHDMYVLTEVHMARLNCILSYFITTVIP